MKRFLIVTTFAATLSFSPVAAFAADAPPDAWLTTKTKLNVLTNVESAGDVNVDTVKGRVTLHGTVPSEADKKAAERAAKEIDGVKDVRNLLQVVAPKKQAKVQAKDEEIRKRVISALQAEKSLDDSDIEVQSVNQRTVLLAGNADSVLDHLRAVEIVRGVDGVKKVASEVKSPDDEADAKIWNEIESAEREQDQESEGVGAAISDAASAVAGATKDAYITSAAKARLLANEDTPGMDINVDTENGVVTLFGTVPTEEAKKQAEAEAREVAGVKQVKNELEVRSGAKTADVDADID